MSKKESKMRAIFGSPKKGSNNWSNPPHEPRRYRAEQHPLKEQHHYVKDENLDLNGLDSYYPQPRIQSVYTHQDPGSLPSCNQILYPSPPATVCTVLTGLALTQPC